MFADVDFQQDLFDGVVRVVIGVFVIVTIVVVVLIIIVVVVEVARI